MIQFLIPPSLIAELWAWRRGDRERMRIEGPSMLPTLRPGEHVLVDPGRDPQPGDLVTACPGALHGIRVVKRLAHHTPDGNVWLTSDNPSAGTDSQTWGALSAATVDGVVTANLSRRTVLVDVDTPRSGRLGGLLR